MLEINEILKRTKDHSHPLNMREWIEIAKSFAIPYYKSPGQFIQREIEDLVIEKFRLTNTTHFTQGNYEIRFRKTAEFGNIALACEGMHYKYQPNNPFIKASGYNRGSRRYLILDEFWSQHSSGFK